MLSDFYAKRIQRQIEFNIREATGARRSATRLMCSAIFCSSVTLCAVCNRGLAWAGEKSQLLEACSSWCLLCWPPKLAAVMRCTTQLD